MEQDEFARGGQHNRPIIH